MRSTVGIPLLPAQAVAEGQGGEDVKKIQPVVLCGGAGTRLWPLSREDYPKQFLPLFEGPFGGASGSSSLLQKTLQRTHALAPPFQDCFLPPIVVGHESYRFVIAEQLRQMEAEAKILLEPVRRNTAPALTLTALMVRESGHDAPLLVMPADHMITDVGAFQDKVMEGCGLAMEGKVVTFGITPSRPETGYGYIQKGDALAHVRPGHRIARFVEKPDLSTATAFLNDGSYLWNSGIFMLTPSVWLDAIAQCAPDMGSACHRAWGGRSHDGPFLRVETCAFMACDNQSIDVAVMEKLTQASSPSLPQGVVLPLGAQWSDVGAWGALEDLFMGDASGNATQGDVQLAHAHNTLAIASSRLVVCVGTNDLVVVETPDAVLVVHKNSTQAVKAAVEQLNQQGRTEGNKHRKGYRPWGWYDTVDVGEQFQVKRLVVRPGGALSLQVHQHRAEHWVVVRGTAKVTKNGAVLWLTENESIDIPCGVTHRLENPGPQDLEIIEVQSGSYLGEDDIVRLDDLYGRSSRPAPPHGD